MTDSRDAAGSAGVRSAIFNILSEELTQPRPEYLPAHFNNAVTRLTALFSAPPKPAPDAMREALEPFSKLFERFEEGQKSRGDNWPGDHVEFNARPRTDKESAGYTFGDLRRAHEAFVSAPVPSPDGAMNEALARHYSIPDESWKGATKDNPMVPPSLAGAAEPDAVQGWEVSISINGENALTIGHSHLSGRDDIDRYAEVVRNCARHLIAFIDGKDLDLGRPAPAVHDDVVRFWRDDALEKSAQIVLGWKADPAIAFEIRELKSDFASPQDVGREAAVEDRWQHVKRGTAYTVEGLAKLQTAFPSDRLADNQIMVVYRSEADGSRWVRSEEEFLDGRFRSLAANGGGRG